MPVNWRIRQDSHLQTLRSKRRMIIISLRMRKWSRWRDSHSRGAMRPAVYETAAVAAESHRRNGLPSIALRPMNSELRSWIHLLDDPEMTFCEDVAGTAFQVFFEMLSLLNCLERDIELDLPRHKLGRVQSEGWWVATVLPRALRFKRPLHRCNACNPNDTKAELNRRNQAFEVLADTGIPVARNGRASG